MPLLMRGRQRMLYARRNATSRDQYGTSSATDALTFNFYRRAASTGFAAVHKLLDSCWMDRPTIIDGDDRLTKQLRHGITKLMKKHWAKIKDAPPQYGWALLSTSDSGER
jgi:hypothetical protein